MEKIDWKVEGMTCSNCALSVSKFLSKEGMEEVKVDPISGAVSFTSKENIPVSKLKSGINNLGYTVVEKGEAMPTPKGFLHNYQQRFLFTLPFTLLLMLHMIDPWIHIHWLMNPWVQLALCLPVFITGMWFFGRSAIKSIKSGVPNMNVLVTLGALAAFIYSMAGFIAGLGHNYLFFETTASIITLVFLGNYLEEASIRSTQKALEGLAKSQQVMANMIAFDGDHQEQVFPIENTQLRTGDLVLIRTGELVPLDCKILWGECSVNEAILTGESSPLFKTKKDFLIGGSVLESGTVKAQVTATGSDTVLSGILKMVQTAQSEKPPMQKLADRISAVFVPLVIAISIATFFVNYLAFDIAFGNALMRSIAVLVISCPCAMGLATPAAIAVGLGRAARKGILFRNAASLESFKDISQVVFDKTGTLTTGQFEIAGYKSFIQDEAFKNITWSLEKFSTHPIAKAIAESWKDKLPVRWKQIEEIRGAGMKATDMEGNTYFAGSYTLANGLEAEPGHNVYIVRNNHLLGWIDVQDQVREEAATIIRWLKNNNIKTILLTGDSHQKAMLIGQALAIDEVFASQSPAQKLEKIASLNSLHPTAMVGDGINDAPALAKATLGISLSDASQLAMQSADVILMNNGLKNLPEALSLGKHTYLTIKQNLFWAFAYNIVAIPIAAAGLLTPALAALAMGFSDVVLAANSLRLFVKKVV